MIRRPMAGVAAAVVVLAVSCSAPDQPDEALARVAILEADADWRQRAIGEFVRATDGQPLRVDDEVRTDATGFAEIAYVDGSLTRLDTDTVFRVTSLAGDVSSPQIQVELNSGRIWNRVREVTASSGRFEVETALGVAAARGTAFWMRCDAASCAISVTHGQVVFTLPDGTELPIAADEGITVGPDGEETRGPIDPDLLEPGGWGGRNLALDEQLARFGDGREGCNVAVAGQSLNAAAGPGEAVAVESSDEVGASLVSLEAVDGYVVDALIGPGAVRVAGGVVQPPARRVEPTLDLAGPVALGVGLHELEVRTSGSVSCVVRGYVRITGRPPLTTVPGMLGLVLALLGAAGLVASGRRAHPRRAV